MDVTLISRRGRRSAVAALVAAFWEYSETLHLLGDERRRRHVLPRYLVGDCADSQAHQGLLGVYLDGRVAGAAAWLPPEAYPIPVRRQLAQIGQLVRVAPQHQGNGIGGAQLTPVLEQADRRRIGCY